MSVNLTKLIFFSSLTLNLTHDATSRLRFSLVSSSVSLCVTVDVYNSASMLLAGPEPTEALGVFVESRAALLFTSLFQVFFYCLQILCLLTLRCIRLL